MEHCVIRTKITLTREKILVDNEQNPLIGWKPASKGISLASNLKRVSVFVLTPSIENEWQIKENFILVILTTINTFRRPFLNLPTQELLSIIFLWQVLKSLIFQNEIYLFVDTLLVKLRSFKLIIQKDFYYFRRVLLQFDIGTRLKYVPIMTYIYC